MKSFMKNLLMTAVCSLQSWSEKARYGHPEVQRSWRGRSSWIFLVICVERQITNYWNR